MDDTNEKDPFDGYSVAIIRTFWFDVINLRIFRGWNRNDYSDAPMKSLRRQIHGNAISEHGVRVIGSVLKTKEFSFSLRADESAVEDWQHIASDTEIKNYEELSANKVRRFEIIEQRCKESAPTAFLGYTEGDGEIGDKSDWWIEALVPEFVMAQLEQDIAAGVIEKLHFGVKWIAGLVDDDLTPLSSVSLTWGLLKKEKDFPETLKGYVTSIGWNLSITPKYTAPCDMEDKGEKEIESVRLLDPTTQSIMALSQVVTALSKRTTSAFVIVTVLIAISYLLR
ncbi:MAG: hypothetical protein ACK48P_04290 [Holosporales bacterium]|jgi:hypothetical protein